MPWPLGGWRHRPSIWAIRSGRAGGRRVAATVVAAVVAAVAEVAFAGRSHFRRAAGGEREGAGRRHEQGFHLKAGHRQSTVSGQRAMTGGARAHARPQRRDRPSCPSGVIRDAV